MARLFAVLGIAVITLGCQHSPIGSPASVADLNADDLAHANHVKWWFIDVPEVPKGKVLCMSFVDEDGIIESRGVSRSKKRQPNQDGVVRLL